MILDGEYAYFQSNPFAQVLDCGHLTLNFYEENKLTENFDFFRYDEKNTSDAMTRVFGKSSSDLVNKYKDQFVLNLNIRSIAFVLGVVSQADLYFCR